MAKFAHKLVAEMAKEFAGTFYEDAARDDVFYKQWPSQKRFIALNWRHFVLTARQIMTQLLALPSTPDDQKEEIYEALLRDRALPAGGDTRVLH